VVVVPFDVNDESLRKTFLGVTVFSVLSELSPNDRPLWGSMSSQQMVEHLLWAMEASNGITDVECRLPAKLIERFKTFLYNNSPTSHDFMNPLLKQGLPPLRFAGVHDAVAALKEQTEDFLDQGDGVWPGPRIHPVFGPIDYEEWSRSHFKHFYHHLLQFGMIGESQG